MSNVLTCLPAGRFIILNSDIKNPSTMPQIMIWKKYLNLIKYKLYD